MNGMAADGSGAGTRRWRPVLWGGAAMLLLAPAAAMLVTAEMNWGPGDFLHLAILLAIGCGAVEAAVRMRLGAAYRGAVAIAVGTALLLAWVTLAVGVIGSEDDPANRLFGLVLAVAAAGAALSRLRPRGMAWTMAATALAQIAVALTALESGLGLEDPGGAAEILALNGLFAAAWLASAWLFRRSARAQEGAGAAR